MARINIEDELFSDPRFKTLELIHGMLLANGIIMHAIKTAQHYWCKDGDEMQCIPGTIFFAVPEMKSLIDVGLAELKEDKVYVKGTRERFAWIFNQRENGKKGGRPAKEKTEINPKVNPEITHGLDSGSIQDTQVKPKPNLQSQSLIQSLNLNIYTATKVLTLFNEKLAGQGGIKQAPFILASNMNEDFKNLSGSPEFQKPNAWENYFEKIKESEYLTKIRPVDLGWILKPENAAAIIGGRYTNRAPIEKSTKQAQIDSDAKSDQLFDTILRKGRPHYIDTMNSMSDVELRAVELFGGSSRIFDTTNFNLDQTKKEFRLFYKQASGEIKC